MQYALDFALTDQEQELPEPNPHDYDHVIVMFSGGKDGLACVLALVEQGIKPELWHHDVDGGGQNFFDWPCTTDYCRKIAEHLGLPFYLSWREGGLERELTKNEDRTSAIHYEKPDGTIGTSGGIRGKIGTRRRWPALSANLATRWCSGVSKIDVGAAAIAGQDRFHGKKLLVITGERAEESPARAKYKRTEPHRTHAPGPRTRRHVTHWRPVLDWPEAKVWAIIKKHGIVPHPCYYLGFGRGSCMICIFSSSRQAATVQRIDPARADKVTAYEQDFKHTIRSGETFLEHAAKAKPFMLDQAMIDRAMNSVYQGPVWTDQWVLPKGAYGENAGPS